MDVMLGIYGDIQLTVSLTEEGEKHWEDIVSLIFHYIKLIGQVRLLVPSISTGTTCYNNRQL